MSRLLIALACLAAMTVVMADTGADLVLQNEEFMVSSDAVAPQRSLLQNRQLAAVYAPKCYWANKNNGDSLVVVVKTTGTYANAELLLRGRTRNVYIAAGSRLRAAVSPFGRQPRYRRRTINTFRFTVSLPLPRCSKNKENLRAQLRRAIRRIRTGSIRQVIISRIR